MSVINELKSLEKEANLALHDIRQGEEISISSTSKEDF